MNIEQLILILSLPAIYLAYEAWSRHRKVKYYIVFTLVRTRGGSQEEINGSAEVTTSKPIRNMYHIKAIEEDLKRENDADKALITFWRRYDG